MTVTKLDSGKYRVDVRPQGRNGKRYRKTFPTKDEAVRYEKYMLATGHNKGWVEKPKDRRRLAELIELWWKHHGSQLPSGHSMHLKLQNIDEQMGHPRACDIGRKSFADYQAMRMQSGIKPETINKARWLLNGVFTVLINTGNYHAENPMKGVKPVRVPVREMGFLSREDVQRLLAALDGDDLRAVKLCLATGGRWGEVKSLNRTAVIPHKVTYVITKNNRSRTIPISEELWKEITAGDTMRLFPGASYDRVRDIIDSLFPWLPEGQALHVLRHTFASHFMMGGGNILTLQRILGHSNITQTMIYAHFSPDHLMDAVKLNPLSLV
ncbi:tyrosine-type recombinase/integrase [Citrobacter werkmanii]|uniref:phage integrase n=1 Tax=Citrobacter werkmanii TaxID=67827 RepID=UPI001571302D|nr:tyrosine-type recombinase/integrase [Citrobacter werkmanii]NSL34571.1 tyrosine-type recombinase/integrase [Citrobacter werkmanii]